MKRNNLIRFVALFACIVLIAATALFVSGCKKENADSGTSSVSESEVISLGAGKTSFDFQVVYDNGKCENYLIKTDKKNVGEALSELGLIEGENGDYGLMVDTVNGVKAVYEEDHKYWAFYVDGNYAPKSADQTEIEKGKKYSFEIEKG